MFEIFFSIVERRYWPLVMPMTFYQYFVTFLLLRLIYSLN